MTKPAHRLAGWSVNTYAVLATLNGVAWVLIGLTFWTAGGHFPHEISITHLVLPGAVFLGLSLFIWRGAPWAMIAAFVFAVFHWAILLGPDPWTLLTHPANSFRNLPNLPYLAVAAVFGILSAVSVVAGRRPAA